MSNDKDTTPIPGLTHARVGRRFSLDRRGFLVATLAGVIHRGVAEAQETPITRPMISETDCPLETIEPIAGEHRGLGVLRKPPGKGPFPAIIWLHGGITTFPLTRLQSAVRDMANPTRFLAAGYVVIAPTYRSRDHDIQSPVSLEDTLAVIEYVRKLPYVDPKSLIVFGCSGGGDLALEAAARTDVSAVVAEEPASVVMSGVFNANTPKKGERFTPEDSFFQLENPKQHYKPEHQKILRAKIEKIRSPILIIQGDEDRQEIPINRFNAYVLIPELRAAKKTLKVLSYPGQAHCFCAASGRPRPAGRAAPASWPSAALGAYRDIEAFCRPYLKTQPKPLDASLLTYAPVPVE
jgi:acetyl esterase/lipase